jgi:ligand-binding SRPBCC domain-containing protein
VSLHRFEARQVVPIAMDEAWEFFSDPRNLALITPPEMGFEVTSPLPERMHPGLIITHRVKPLLGLPVTWVTEISHVVEGELFVDEQRFGPYRFWHHQHHFREAPGGVEIGDIVNYALPFGPLGDLVNSLLVEDRVRAIFAYRRAVLERRFGRVPAPA